MLYYMSYLIYLWRLHRTLMVMHGVYVSYNMIVWIVGGTKKTYEWIISWFPEPQKQIEDKKYKEETIENEYTLLTQT